MGVEAQGRCVFARDLDKVFATAKALFWNARQITCGIFDSDDMFVSGQLAHGFNTHIHCGTAGNIIDDYIYAAVRSG